ncbi:hypothetical protein OESDEN_01909 [Oesophagostomum dentatum]|uniref:Uncharacterized protein n=1 Tax=Oesophagostomum dentatum TaxID=61180 RepID=A0A0B1TLI1_OESDE|nr:hypothetical protein OESDEN_01909 [Oesophagostomum dentatum]
MSPLRQAFTLADDDLAALHLLYPMKGKSTMRQRPKKKKSNVNESSTFQSILILNMHGL